MKSYDEYLREYNELKKNNKDPYIVRQDAYITHNFFADIGASEPWKPEAQERIIKALEGCSERDQELFSAAIQSYMEFFDERTGRK